MGTTFEVLDRLSLGIQQPFYFLDDFIAMGQEQLEKFDMRVKRHLAKTWCGWPVFGCKRMYRSAHHKTPPESEAKYWLNSTQCKTLRSLSGILSTPDAVLGAADARTGIQWPAMPDRRAKPNL